MGRVAQCDASLKARDPRWGVRDMEAVAAVAKKSGLELEEAIARPSNNFTLVFRRPGGAAAPPAAPKPRRKR